VAPPRLASRSVSYWSGGARTSVCVLLLFLAPRPRHRRAVPATDRSAVRVVSGYTMDLSSWGRIRLHRLLRAAGSDKLLVDSVQLTHCSTTVTEVSGTPQPFFDIFAVLQVSFCDLFVGLLL
jgi:hypothetical protein